MSRNWHVVRTKPQQEYLAAFGLRDQGFEVYLPKTYRREMRGKRVESVSSLRFGEYIFVAFDASNEEHGPIDNTRGVAQNGLICTGGANPKPKPCRHGEIEVLRRAEDDEHEFASRRTKRLRGASQRLRPGAKVRIDRPGGHGHGQEGYLLASIDGVCSILIGLARFDVPDMDVIVLEDEKAKKQAAA